MAQQTEIITETTKETKMYLKIAHENLYLEIKEQIS
jgi:hypothetical protein